MATGKKFLKALERDADALPFTKADAGKLSRLDKLINKGGVAVDEFGRCLSGYELKPADFWRHLFQCFNVFIFKGFHFSGVRNFLSINRKGFFGSVSGTTRKDTNPSGSMNVSNRFGFACFAF